MNNPVGLDGGRFATVALLFLFLVGPVASALPAGADVPVGQLRPLISSGESAPSFVLKDLGGKRVAFHPGGGRPSLLVFWSVSCPICRELTPMMNDISRRFSTAVPLIGVNLDGPRFSNAVRAFIKEKSLIFPVGLDDIRNDLFIASDQYGVEHTPTVVVVDGSGKVRKVYVAERVYDFIKNIDTEISYLQKTAKKGFDNRK